MIKIVQTDLCKGQIKSSYKGQGGKDTHRTRPLKKQSPLLEMAGKLTWKCLQFGGTRLLMRHTHTRRYLHRSEPLYRNTPFHTDRRLVLGSDGVKGPGMTKGVRGKKVFSNHRSLILVSHLLHRRDGHSVTHAHNLPGLYCSCNRLLFKRAQKGPWLCLTAATDDIGPSRSRVSYYCRCNSLALT